jgi:hypothetical protein
VPPLFARLIPTLRILIAKAGQEIIFCDTDSKETFAMKSRQCRISLASSLNNIAADAAPALIFDIA